MYRRPFPTPAGLHAAVVSALVVVLAPGCVDGESAGSAEPSADPSAAPERSQRFVAETLDSMGIVLRRSPAAALERTAYSVEPVPRLLLDGTEGGGRPLHAIGAVAFGPGGTLAIAERGEMGVRIHDTSGARLRVIGREGQGPGEFGALNGLGFRGDSLFVFDSRWSRISVFDPEGEHVRQFVPGGTRGERPRWFAFGAEAGILTTSGGTGDFLVWGLHGFDGARIALFADAPSPAAPTMRMLGPSSGSARASEPLRLFTAQPIAGLWNRHVVVTSAEHYRLEIRDASGDLLEIWSVADALPRRVTSADVDAARDRAIAASDPDLRPIVERRWSDVEIPERFPAFGAGEGMVFTAPPQILESAAGEIWVRGWPADPAPVEASPDAPDDAPSPRWWVFERGSLLGSVDFPPGFDLHAVSETGALGILEDAYDVQRVAVFGLTSARGR